MLFKIQNRGVRFVLEVVKQQNFMVVDLKEGVKVHTLIPSENHAALRCGFAGYPTNPRWTAAKFHAWKTGQQLKESLSRGEMIVRSGDSMLVAASETQDKRKNSPETSESEKCSPGFYQFLISSFRMSLHINHPSEGESQITQSTTSPTSQSNNLNNHGMKNHGMKQANQNRVSHKYDREFIEVYPDQGYSQDVRKKCLHLYLEGNGFRRIERLTGVSRHTLVNWVKEAGSYL
jgi:transposase-like protein